MIGWDIPVTAPKNYFLEGIPMYMDKQVKRGYNEYIRLDEGIGKDAMMDVALLVMEDGDT